MKLPEIVNRVEADGKIYDFQTLSEDKKKEISLLLQDRMMKTAGYERKQKD